MRTRIGLGPVFYFEWLTQARRWQFYAVRSGIAAALLVAAWLLWVSAPPHVREGRSLAAYAEFGRALYTAVMGTLLALVLLAAPAATAGAICLDKARGALAQVLATDLSDSEIVVGKLAARLLPVLSLLLVALPVVAVLLLLGGIDPQALLGAMMIAVGLAALGCSLALVFSVWGTKTHEVLLATYATIGLWLLAIPIGKVLGYRGRGWWGNSDVLEATNPFFLAFRPYLYPGTENVTGGALFLLATLAVSAALISLATVCMRRVALMGPRVTRAGRRLDLARLTRPLLDLLPGPSLDGNPVLWREWHRSRPSRWSFGVGLIYWSLSSAFIGLLLWNWSRTGRFDEMFAAWTSGWVGSIGLLLLSIVAPTSLTEERVRGSLDVLMATPLSTRQIVLGKWWGAARRAILLSVPPVLLIACAGLSGGSAVSWVPLALLWYAMAAAIVSLGLALATFLARPGRAVAITVAIYLGVTVGWLFAVLTLNNGPGNSWSGFLSPFFAMAEGAFCLARRGGYPQSHYYSGTLLWTPILSAFAAITLVVTIASFNHALGRVSAIPHRPPLRLKPRIGRGMGDLLAE